MSFHETPNYQFRKPLIGNDWGKWGINLNFNFDKVDEILVSKNRKTMNFRIEDVIGADTIGSYSQITSGSILSATPLTTLIGSHKLIFNVTSATPNVIKVSGTKLSQNTLIEEPGEELIDIPAPGLYVTRKTWTKAVDITSDVGCTSDIYKYGGFYLDKNLKIVKIKIRGTCNNLVNNLFVKLKIFEIDNNNVTIKEISDLNIDHVFGTGTDFFWHKELSLNEIIEESKREFIIETSSTVPTFWNNVMISLDWE